MQSLAKLPAKSKGWKDRTEGSRRGKNAENNAVHSPQQPIPDAFQKIREKFLFARTGSENRLISKALQKEKGPRLDSQGPFSLGCNGKSRSWNGFF
jgi:hypothetical protein